MNFSKDARSSTISDMAMGMEICHNVKHEFCLVRVCRMVYSNMSWVI